jgi:hypothetical protein
MRALNRVIKGLALAFTLLACLIMTFSSGAALNPAHGLAQSVYTYAMAENAAAGSGKKYV